MGNVLKADSLKVTQDVLKSIEKK